MIEVGQSSAPIPQTPHSYGRRAFSPHGQCRQEVDARVERCVVLGCSPFEWVLFMCIIDCMLTQWHLELRNHPPEGMVVGPTSDDDLFHWEATIVYVCLSEW